jgi:hypothetical protein
MKINPPHRQSNLGIVGLSKMLIARPTLQGSTPAFSQQDGPLLNDVAQHLSPTRV